MNAANKSLQEMKQEALARLAPFKAKYPRIFSHLEFMDIEDGWIPLIESLSQIIEEYIERHVPKEQQNQVYYEQIKQKLGSLRIHMNEHIPYVQGAIAMAEEQSYTICEKCGNHGSVRQLSWITVLCDAHYQQKINSE